MFDARTLTTYGLFSNQTSCALPSLRMSAEIPQYFKNTLVPVKTDRPSLQNALDELQAAVKRGVTLIESNCPPPDPNHNHAFGSIYNGELGMATSTVSPWAQG